MTIVINLDRQERSVRLHATGFESCTVSPLGFRVELKLARHFQRPWQTRVGMFVDEMLAASLQPARSATEVRALSEVDRAKLRRALVVAAGVEHDWRSLYGSHLSADERLFAVMYWSWKRRLRTRRQLRAEHDAYLTSLREGVLDSTYARLGLADTVRASANIELALGGAAAKFAPAALISAEPMGAVKALEAHAAWSRDLSKVFENPLADLAANIERITSLTSTVESMRSLTNSVGVFAASPPNTGLAGSVSLPYVNSALTAAVSGEPFSRMARLTSAEFMPWAASSKVADMVKGWQVHSQGLASLMEVRLPSLTELVDVSSRVSGAMDVFRQMERVTGPLRELAETMALVDQFDRRWQNEALYFILSGCLAVCDMWEMRELASLTRDEVEETVLLALEMVLGDEQFVAALRAEVARAPYINSSQATNLDHALEHAARQEYVHACASLYWGLEGAFWEVGYATAVVTLERTDPKKTTRAVGFESMVKRLKLGQDLKTFMVRGLYGTTGNAYRHGGADSGERRQVLLGVAALTGWFEEFAGVHALTALAEATARALPAAVQQVAERPRLLPASATHFDGSRDVATRPQGPLSRGATSISAFARPSTAPRDRGCRTTP